MTVQQLIQHVTSSLNRGANNESQLTEEILYLDGMSGRRFRHFLNNLCAVPMKYMEVGAYKGSTIISALYKNQSEGITFDNWSEYGGPKEEFLNNVATHIGDAKLAVHECDCFAFNRERVRDVDVYFYDGAHDMYSQYRGISYFKPCLSKPAVLIVDDWHNQHAFNAQKGTRDALTDLGIQVLWEWDTNHMTETGSPHRDWWGAQFIALIQ